MSTLMWTLGMNHGVPLTENEVRTTVEPIRTDNENAQADEAPEFNEPERDTSSQLTGLSHRMQAPETKETEQYIPWWTGMASADFESRIDRQVSSSGTAAAREQAGQQGHGTMQYSESIDPVIREGASFGNEYFVVNDSVIQEGSGNYMLPADEDNFLQSIAQQRANTASRKAYQSSVYESWLANG